MSFVLHESFTEKEKKKLIDAHALVLFSQKVDVLAHSILE